VGFTKALSRKYPEIPLQPLALYVKTRLFIRIKAFNSGSLKEVNCEYSEEPKDIEDEDCEEEMVECNNRRYNAFEQQESIWFHEYFQGSHNDSVI
jgi:hypothetical protein